MMRPFFLMLLMLCCAADVNVLRSVAFQQQPGSSADISRDDVGRVLGEVNGSALLVFHGGQCSQGVPFVAFPGGTTLHAPGATTSQKLRDLVSKNADVSVQEQPGGWFLIKDSRPVPLLNVRFAKVTFTRKERQWPLAAIGKLTRTAQFRRTQRALRFKEFGAMYDVTVPRDSPLLLPRVMLNFTLRDVLVNVVEHRRGLASYLECEQPDHQLISRSSHKAFLSRRVNEYRGGE